MDGWMDGYSLIEINMKQIYKVRYKKWLKWLKGRFFNETELINAFLQ